LGSISEYNLSLQTGSDITSHEGFPVACSALVIYNENSPVEKQGKSK